MRVIQLFVQFIHIYKKYGLQPALIKTRRYIYRLFTDTTVYSSVPSVPYEPPYPIDPKVQTDIKLIAYYLPQFHRFPENDVWWGKGFTEWTNVRRSKPMFPEHIQPNFPHSDIGFYDLLDFCTIQKQVALAKHYGIYGFCFHHYWFSGKRLMEKPVDSLLEHPELEIPFCLNWANENWTRRWDGEDKKVLIAQQHSPEDDILFMEDLLKYFKDSRYIRIDNRPMFQVYQAKTLPDMKATLERWRGVCKTHGETEPYFILVQSFRNENPHEYGFDAAVQFPPHLPSWNFPPNIFIKGTSKSYKGVIKDYIAFAEAVVNDYTDMYTLYPCLFPGWDNTPRRLFRSSIFACSTPQRYRKWLTQACRFVVSTQQKENQFVFINAWNEWAEGAHLEPSQQHGYAYLNTTARVLENFAVPLSVTPEKIQILLIIGHDAFLAGAQRLLLEVIQWLKRNTGIECKLLLLSDGIMLEEYKETLPTLLCPAEDVTLEMVKDFCGGIPNCILGNTAVSAKVYNLFSLWNIPIVTHVHELEASLQKFAGEKAITALLKHSNRIIAASEPVRQNLIIQHGFDPQRCVTVDSFLEPRLYPVDKNDKQLLRQSLGLPEKGCLFLGCGTKDWRKGIDIFVEVAKDVAKHVIKEPPVFCWIGKGEDLSLPSSFFSHLDKLHREVIFIDEIENPGPYFQAADVFLLPSREDPFPLVALMAALCQCPIICFADAGGIPQLVSHDAGIIVPYENVSAMTQACIQLASDETLREQLGKPGRKKVLSQYTTDVAVPRILQILEKVIDTT